MLDTGRPSFDWEAFHEAHRAAQMHVSSADLYYYSMVQPVKSYMRSRGFGVSRSRHSVRSPDDPHANALPLYVRKLVTFTLCCFLEDEPPCLRHVVAEPATLISKMLQTPRSRC